jgi:predicted nucleic acid-binding protein
VIEQGQGYPETPLIERAVQDGWLQQKPLQDENLASLLKLYLGAGEAEAIALAVQEQPDVLLLDDSEARLVARQMNLRVRSDLGIPPCNPTHQPPHTRNHNPTRLHLT